MCKISKGDQYVSIAAYDGSRKRIDGSMVRSGRVAFENGIAEEWGIGIDGCRIQLIFSIPEKRMYIRNVVDKHDSYKPQIAGSVMSVYFQKPEYVALAEKYAGKYELDYSNSREMYFIDLSDGCINDIRKGSRLGSKRNQVNSSGHGLENVGEAIVIENQEVESMQSELNPIESFILGALFRKFGKAEIIEKIGKDNVVAALQDELMRDDISNDEILQIVHLMKNL